MSRKDFSQQFISPPQLPDTTTQFPSPPELPKTTFPQEVEVYSTPPEDVFPVFQPENVFVNTPPLNNPPVNTPPINTPHVDLQNNPFGFSEAYLRELEQDEENLREIRQNEAREEDARLEHEDRDVEYLRQNWFDIMKAKYYAGEFRSSSSGEGYNSDDSYS